MKALLPRIVSIVIVFGITFFNGCCCNNEREVLTFDSIQAINIDNSGRTPISPPVDSVPYKAYAIEIHIDWLQVSSNLYRGKFGSTAFALSCDDQSYTEQSIDTFIISSTTNFNQEYVANETLNDLFTFSNSFNVIGKFSNPITLYLNHEGDENKELAFIVHAISGQDTLGADTTDIVRLYRKQ